MKKSMKGFIAVFVMAIAFYVTGITSVAATITQAAQDKNSVTITWPAQESAVEYYIGIGADLQTARAQAESKAITLPATTTSHTFSGLAEGTSYYAYVRYKYARNNKTYDAAVGYEQITTVPGKVTGVNQSKWWYYVKSVDFEWDRQGAIGAVRYEYVIRDNKNKVLKTDETSSKGGGFSNVKNNKLYKLQVRAYITVNGQKFYGDWSDTAYLFTQPMVKKASISGNKLKISWEKIDGLTGYDVYVSTKEKSGYKKVKSLSKSKNSLTVSKLKGKKFSKKKKYYIYIVGKKKVGKITYTSGRHYTYEVKQKKLNWTFN